MRHVLAWCLLAAVPVAAGATPTAFPSFNAPLPGTTAAAEPVLAGAVLSDQLVPFSSPPGYSLPTTGTVQVRVVRGADGKLAFYWKINNAARSRDYVRSVEIEGYPRHVYDANWRSDGLGTIAPASVRGWIAADGFYRLGFVWNTPIRAGQSSRFFFLRSPAANLDSPDAKMTLVFGNARTVISIKRPAGA